MRITFVIPGSARFPVGGYKVAFEYANAFAMRGHQVTLIFPAMLDPTESLARRAYHLGRYVLWGITQSYGPGRWFQLDRRVAMHWTPSLQENHIPDGDAIIATGWPTAEFVARYAKNKGRKFYFIQHLETWWGDESRVLATWRLPLEKIVIARWLEEIARSCGEASTYIPNGLDQSALAIDVPIERRNPHSVLMLFHKYKWKGSDDGLRALKLARAQVPDLKAALFGIGPPPAHIPSWITYHRNPSQSRLRALYNEAAIFLAPSWTEGWPLPPAEAMLSGCAVVATDIGGHDEYAKHGVTALLAHAKEPESLARQLILSLTNQETRIRIAKEGNRFIRQFEWSPSADKFEAVLTRSISEGRTPADKPTIAVG